MKNRAKHPDLLFRAMLILTITLLTSCSILLSSPLEIISWTPGNQAPAVPAQLTVSVTFNREPEPVCTGEAFSITLDGTEPAGRISLDGCVLSFTPWSPLSAGCEYVIKVSTMAEDYYGNSLASDFVAEFRTGEAGSRPGIESITPADGSLTASNTLSVIIEFDQPVDLDSLISAFSISPEVAGVCELDSDRRIFTFTPAQKLEWQQEYTVGLSVDLRTEFGYSLAEEFSSVFTVGTDAVPPEIIKASSLDETVTVYESPAGSPSLTVNRGWEKDGAVRISFSEEVERQSAKTSVTIEPAARFDLSFDEGRSPADMIISFSEALQWQKLYRLALAEGIRDLQGNCIEDGHVYYFYIDGDSSRPPEISRVETGPGGGTLFCLYNKALPAAAVGSHQFLDTSGGDAVIKPWFIDYYITLASGAGLPFFEFAENFLISPDDSCISFTYHDFQLFNPGVPVDSAALPLPSPAADEAVVRMVCSLTDSCTASGTILMQVYGDLTDNLGNPMSEDWTAEFFDEDP